MYRLGRVQGTLNILLSLGFIEEEGGVLRYPFNSNLNELKARKLELETGLEMLTKSIESFELSKGDTKSLGGKSSQDDKKLLAEKLREVVDADDLLNTVDNDKSSKKE